MARSVMTYFDKAVSAADSASNDFENRSVVGEAKFVVQHAVGAILILSGRCMGCPRDGSRYKKLTHDK